MNEMLLIDAVLQVAEAIGGLCMVINIWCVTFLLNMILWKAFGK